MIEFPVSKPAWECVIGHYLGKLQPNPYLVRSGGYGDRIEGD